MEMEKVISWRPDRQTVVIERQLKKWDPAPDSSRSARLQRAIAAGMGVEDWSVIQGRLRDLDREEADVPSSMQVRLDSEACAGLDQIREAIKATSSTELKKPRLSYVFRLILFNYLLLLQNDGTEETEATQSDSASRLDGVRLLQTIAELLLSDTETARAKIQRINRICQD